MTYDAVFVGSGINSLAGAALLARAGWTVCVLEREAVAGGCIRTSSELTLPGFTHEVMASWHPLFTGSAAYAELKDELDRRGVEYINTDLPTGTAFPDGSAAFVSTSLEANVAELERHAAGDGAAWERQFNEFMANADLSFGLLGTELWSGAGLGLGRTAYRRLGRRGLLEFAGRTLVSCRDWVTETFESEAAHGLLAPWVLHTGLGPDQATSGFMTQVIAAALQLGGMPVPRRRRRPARRRPRRDRHRRRRVCRHERGRRAHRRLGREGNGRPRLRGRGLSRVARGRRERDADAALRPAPGDTGTCRPRSRPLQSASATAAPRCRSTSRWTSSRAGRGRRPSASRAARSCTSRPASTASRAPSTRPSAACCRPRPRSSAASRSALDPSRAPDGKWIIWIQLQELPAGRVKGDAAGEIDTGDGTWTEELREAYADRIVARLGESIANVGPSTLRRVVLSPADIEALNVNLVGGDIYGGSCALDQNLLWRPFAQAPGHANGGRGPVPHRREHAPGAGPRRRLRVPRRRRS